jgi:hypothetical protein
MPKMTIEQSIEYAQKNFSFDPENKKDIQQSVKEQKFIDPDIKTSVAIQTADAEVENIPSNRRSALNQPFREARRLKDFYNNTDYYPTIEELKEYFMELGLTIESDKDLLLIHTTVFSINSNDMYDDLSYDPQILDLLEEQELTKNLWKTIIEIRDKSDPETADRNFKIFCLKFGFNDESKEYSNKELAEMFKLTSTRISQIVNNYLRKFRHPYYKRLFK